MGMKPRVEVLPAEEPCGCGPRKSYPDCTKNPNPICPCGAWYNFTCYCTRSQIDAFKAGRKFEASRASVCVGVDNS